MSVDIYIDDKYIDKFIESYIGPCTYGKNNFFAKKSTKVNIVIYVII